MFVSIYMIYALYLCLVAYNDMPVFLIVLIYVILILVQFFIECTPFELIIKTKYIRRKEGVWLSTSFLNVLTHIQ